MAWCKTAVTPLLKHWSYCSLALSLRYVGHKYTSVKYIPKMACPTHTGARDQCFNSADHHSEKRTLHPWGSASIITRFLNVFSSENIVILDNLLQSIRNGCNKPAQKIMAHKCNPIIIKGSTRSACIAIRQNQSLHGGTCLPFSYANITVSLTITAHWHTC